MTPEISEFSYGFALTNEVVAWAPVSAAPLFPSLIEEGKAGGGYDVALNLAGVALYLQFKRADCMVRATAREIGEYNLPIRLPFYRFKITESGKSDQHELLLALEDADNLVFYAAPRFHQLDEINDAWNQNRVAARSIFVSPNDIGVLDEESHHIAYDDMSAWLCSDPYKIEFSNASEILGNIQNRLKMDPRPLSAKLPEMVEKVEVAKERAFERMAERRRQFKEIAIGVQSTVRAERGAARSEVPLRSPRKLSDSEHLLRNLSDEAAKVFNAQLIIVQQLA